MKLKKKWSKGEMSRTIVIYCIKVMTGVLVWAVVLKTLGVIFGWDNDMSDVLTFCAASFGGELILLAFKRIFAKKGDSE